MSESFHFPPDLLELLVDAIPRLFRSKQAVLDFFQGCGVPSPLLADLQTRVRQDRDSVKKAGMVRQVLVRLNERGERRDALRARREVVKRVVQFDDFSLCWENDRLPAEGLVSKIRTMVQAKDSFSRMKQERDAERQARMAAQDAATAEKRRGAEAREELKEEFFGLFAETDPQKRGTLLEGVLNRLFEHEGILVRESFRRRGASDARVVEQIDGVVELDARIFLVEMKWLAEPVGKGDAAEHLVRVFSRPEAHALFISYTSFTAGALEASREAIHGGKVSALCTLQELVATLEKGRSVADLLRFKVNAAIVDKNPYVEKP